MNNFKKKLLIADKLSLNFYSCLKLFYNDLSSSYSLVLLMILFSFGFLEALKLYKVWTYSEILVVYAKFLLFKWTYLLTEGEAIKFIIM